MIQIQSYGKAKYLKDKVTERLSHKILSYFIELIEIQVICTGIEGRATRRRPDSGNAN